MIKNILALAALVLLTNCAEPINHPMDMTAAIQNATTKADHEALAAQYEQMAQQMKMLAEEHRKRLAEYQALLPKEDLQHDQFITHCSQLIKIYTQAEQENLELARLHHRIASSLSN